MKIFSSKQQAADDLYKAISGAENTIKGLGFVLPARVLIKDEIYLIWINDQLYIESGGKILHILSGGLNIKFRGLAVRRLPHLIKELLSVNKKLA